MKSRWFVLAGLLMLAGMTLTAQQRGQRGRRGGGPDQVAQVRDALGLNSDQVSQLRALMDARAQSEQAARDNVQARIDALANLEDQSPKDAAAIEKAGQDLRQAEQAQQGIGAKFRSDFMNLLTPDQKNTLDSISGAAARANALNRLGVLNNGRGGNGRGRGGRPPGGPGTQGRALAPAPPDNPLTSEKVALGKSLFSDKRLSADGTVSCASCHDPSRAFTDGRALTLGIHNAEGSRNSPSLVEAGFNRSFFWDGRAPTLERQVLQPILNPKELGLNEADIEKRVGVQTPDVVAALASYVRTIRSTDSRYDRFQAGDVNALTDFERAGLDIFRGKGRCGGCHGGPDFTDNQFHNTGVAWNNDHFADEGRYTVTLNPRDQGKFKTPTLREIAVTGPYMHDGSLATLEDVVDFYSKGGRRNRYLDPRIRPLELSAGEQKALVAFLKTLSGTVHDGL